MCGASLIHPDILITAGHCALFFTSGAYIGGIRLDGTDGEQHDVEEIYIHEEYPGSGAKPHDIALLKLSNRSSVTPVQYAGSSEDPPVASILKVVGYGALSEGGPISSHALEADLAVSPFQICNAIYSNLLEEFMFCTLSPPELGTDSCQVRGSLRYVFMESRS